MQFLSKSRSFLQSEILLPDKLFFLLPGFDFDCAGVPSFDTSLFHERVVTNEEPSVNAVFSAYSRLEFKRIVSPKSRIRYCSQVVDIIGMSNGSDNVL